MSTGWLSLMDSIYLFTYALGNMISGSLGDKYSLHYLIAGGLIVSSLGFSLFVILGFAGNYISWLFLLLWIVQGLAQSTVWPGCVGLLGNWFDKTNRGKVMGLFSASAPTGNFCSALISGWLLGSGYSWMHVMLIFTIFEAVVGVLFLVIIKDNPQQQLGEASTEIMMNSFVDGSVVLTEEESQATKKTKKEGIPFMEALKIPNILNFALAFACVKFLAYTLSMWLPFYLKSVLGKSDFVGILASILELGAILGGVMCGWLGDKMKTRPPVISFYLACALPCLFILPLIGQSVFWIYFLMIPLTGFFVGGVNLILASAVPADLAENKRILNLYQAMATVAGIIDGSGGLGAAIGTLVVGQLASAGWEYVFAFMIVMGTVAFSLLFKITRREVQRFLQRRSMNSTDLV